VGDLPELAAELGADVPSQLVPALSLVRGAGERIERLPDPSPHAVVLLPGGGGLSTARVFEESDRLGLGRSAGELDEIEAALGEAAGAGASPLAYADLLVNDLEPAALALRPEIEDALDSLRGAGAGQVMLSGTGPTAVGVCEDIVAAERVAARLDREVDAIVCEAGRAPDGT
jgi:4-diphosphocytidyl-2-C-methyl-D-erythritol kinase